MGNLILKAALAYLEKHPEVIEELVEQAVRALIAELKKAHSS